MDNQADNGTKASFTEYAGALLHKNYVQNKAIINLLVAILAKLENGDKELIMDEIVKKMDKWDNEISIS